MNRFRVLLYLLTAVVSVILILYGLNIFPTPGTDSRVFIPTALMYSRGLGLVNPLYDVSVVGVETNISNAIKFNYYVPFFPMMLGILSRVHPGIKTIFFICSLFSVSSLLLYSRTLVSILPGRISGAIKALALCSIVYVATYIIPTIGRPENLTALLVLFIYLLYSRRHELNPILYNSLICIIFAVMFASQIICFYFCFIFFVISELGNTTNVLKTILANTLRFIAIALLFAIILSTSPHGLVDTITTIRLHSESAMTRSDRSLKLFINYWLLWRFNTGFLVLFLLCITFYLKNTLTRLKSSKPIVLVLISGLHLMLLYGIARFILYASPTVYNATQFILPLSVYLLTNILSMPENKKRIPAIAFTMVTYVAGIIVFLRIFVLFIDYKKDGKDFTAASAVFNRYVRGSKNTYVTVNLWPLADDANDVKLFDEVHFKKDDTLVVQQMYMPSGKAFLSRCTLIYDWRTGEKRKFLGIPITNTPQGYSFAVYKVN